MGPGPSLSSLGKLSLRAAGPLMFLHADVGVYHKTLLSIPFCFSYPLCMCHSGSPHWPVSTGRASTIAHTSVSHPVHRTQRVLINQRSSANCGLREVQSCSEAPLDTTWILIKMPPALQLPVTLLLLTHVDL